MSLSILWNIPSNLNPNLTYSINVYAASGAEDNPYSLINTISAGPSNSTYTYIDTNGSGNMWYYVTYIPVAGVEGPPVIAMLSPSITAIRLANRVYSYLPEVITVRIDSIQSQVYAALQNALNMMNAYAPVTFYSMTNLPPSHQTAIEFGAQMLLYMEIMLQISIRDFSYGVSGISLNIDRGAKMNTVLTMLRANWTEYLKYVKFLDYPDAIGLGSSAVAVPQARTMGILFNQGGL